MSAPPPRCVLVIPARRGSTRFPNKPMAIVEGKTLLQRTWQIAQAVKHVDQIWIATDDSEIMAFAKSFGANVVLTSPNCENGTTRSFDAITKLGLKPEVIINLQGDALLTPPWVIQAVVEEMLGNPALEMATPATHLPWEKFEEFQKSKQNGRASGTLVVFDLEKRALYFSKGTLPFLRSSSTAAGHQEKAASPYYRHIGLYAYRYATLQSYCILTPTPLEQVEKLEQLRALEHGIPIRIVLVDYRGRTHWSIDNPEDVEIAEAIIRQEGELVP